MSYGDFSRTTELEAINVMLGCIGQAPVNSIPTSGASKATMARDVLYEFSRNVQIEGLCCNTDTEFELTPNTSNNIEIPNSALNVDPSYQYQNRYTERAGKLYDTKDKTYTITETVACDIIWFLEWEELPQHVRRYILILAARAFQERYVSDSSTFQFTQDDEDKAKRQFDRKEMNNSDFSILDNTRVNPRYYRSRGGVR